MRDVLEGPRLKIRRAYQGIQELDAEIRKFGETSPYELLGYENTKGEQILQIRINHEPPAFFGIIIGEIVHNLRSALDHLACVVPLVADAVRPRRPQFPVFRLERPDPKQPNVKDFTSNYKFRVGDITPAVFEIVEAVQPYHPAGNSEWHPLGLLEALWNWDKHNAIHIVTGNCGVSNVPDGAPEDAFASPGPIYDTQVLARFPAGGLTIGSDRTEPFPNIQFAIQPAFGEPGPAHGRALFETLARTHAYVDRTVMAPLERVIRDSG